MVWCCVVTLAGTILLIFWGVLPLCLALLVGPCLLFMGEDLAIFLSFFIDWGDVGLVSVGLWCWSVGWSSCW